MSGMDRIVTLAQRKAAEAERRQSAVDAMRPVLAAYGRAHGGPVPAVRFGSTGPDAVR
jgi:hypothetical protein